MRAALLAVSVTVPVVLDVFGVVPTHYTSDLVLVNRGPVPTQISLAYRPAPGTPGAGTSAVLDSVGAGRELYVADVVQYLRDHGAPLPASGPAILGSLAVTFLDVTDPAFVFAGSRASTRNPDASVGGSFGLFASAVPAAGPPAGSITVFGLREDAAFRSNLALVDLPGGSGPATVSIQLWDGDTGAAAGAPIPYVLQTGDFHQFNSILALRGVKNGWATVTPTGGGSDPFYVYGVSNDGPASGGGTSDGSFLAPGTSDGLVPIVLRVTSAGTVYTSELILANPTATTIKESLTYTPAAQLAPGPPVTTVVSVPSGRQLRFADVVTYLGTTLGLPIPGAASQGGTLLLSGGAAALVRTSNPNADARVGGTFGVAYPAYAAPARAASEAWVYGLRQDALARSNLAIADARAGDPTTVSYVVDLYDAASGNGTPAATLGPYALTGGQWMQLSSVLSSASLAAGYARVRPTGGTSDFVSYAVVNDGSAPGRGTSDGSYVASLPVPAPVVLAYVPGSTAKVEQLIGDCDWPDIEQRGVCTPTGSRTTTRSDVLGTDLGSNFESPLGLVFLFGDTIGQRTLYHAGDTMATSASTDPSAPLVLDFLTKPDGTAFLVQPPGVAMGPDDVPDAGISLGGTIYVVCSTGSDTTSPTPHANDRSVLTRFDPAARTFTVLRTMSALPGGHFVNVSLQQSGSDVLVFGLGDYHATDVYLAKVPASAFETGAGTVYFSGLVDGQPTWTSQESGAVPVLLDNPLHHLPPDTPSIGNLAVVWSADLGLWLMTFDGGRQSQATTGVFFSYAAAPWGPWSAPQLVFNAARDGGLGVFIHDPGLVPDDKLDGPTIDPANNPPATTRGGDYAPFLIGRFTRVSGDLLTVAYTLSTWNPYTVVRMKSSFRIAQAP